MKYKVLKNFKALKTFFITGQIIEGQKAIDLDKYHKVKYLVRDGLVEIINSDIPEKKEDLPKYENNFANIIKDLSTKPEKKKKSN